MALLSLSTIDVGPCACLALCHHCQAMYFSGMHVASCAKASYRLRLPTTMPSMALPTMPALQLCVQC